MISQPLRPPDHEDHEQAHGQGEQDQVKGMGAFQADARSGRRRMRLIHHERLDWIAGSGPIVQHQVTRVRLSPSPTSLRAGGIEPACRVEPARLGIERREGMYPGLRTGRKGRRPPRERSHHMLWQWSTLCNRSCETAAFITASTHDSFPYHPLPSISGSVKNRLTPSGVIGYESRSTGP